MKKLTAFFMALALILTDTPISADAKTKVALNQTNLTLQVGENYQLKLKNAGTKAKIYWVSSKKKIASVSQKGKVTAKKAGTAKITAKLSITDGTVKKYVCTVKVKSAKKPSATKTPAATKAPAATKTPEVPATSPTPVVPTPTPQIIYIEVTSTPQIIYIEVTPTPVLSPTQEPTAIPTQEPTAIPTQEPTAVPTQEPTIAPTEAPILSPAPEGNLTYQSDVTREMTNASYWINRCEEPDKIMLDAAGIQKANEKMLAEKATNMYDLLNLAETFDGTARKENLAAAIESEVKKGRVNGREFYRDGKKVTDPDAFFNEMKENILGAVTTTEAKRQYALCVKRADMKMAPVTEPIGWSALDPDDEFINSSMNINEPLVIEAVTADGKFYWGRNTNCVGWVEAENFAICDTKEEWKDMWTKTGEDILVVTTSQITLAASNYDKKTSKLELMLGTTLPLVPKAEVPANINERGPWYNYIVYVPTRDEQGKFVRSIAMIGMHHDVSVGYLPFTKRNILNVAFTCLGDRYGWGGMLDAMDCSLYTRSIYKCFGFEVPRNTTWQTKIPSENINLSEMTDDEKKVAIRTCEPGTLLMFPGHITMYIGEVDGKQYVISDLGSLAETEAQGTDVNVKSIYSVAVNSLDVRRKNGNTWLKSMTVAVCPWKYKE